MKTITGLVAAALGAWASAGAAFAQQAQPQQISIAAGPQGSINYTISVGIASLASKHAGVNVLAIAYAGSQLSLPLVEQGDPMLGVNNGGIVHQGLTGTGEFTRPHPALRLLSSGSPNTITIAVQADSAIKTGADIRGKRIAAKYVALPTCHDHTAAVLANLGMGWDDVKQVPVSNIVTASKALGDGQADAMLCASPAIAALREVHSKTPLRFISVDPSPAAMARAQKFFKYSEQAALLKKGAMGWLPDDTYMLEFPWVLFVNANLPEDTAYRIVKAMWEHNDELGTTHPILAGWKPARMVDADIGVPYHTGAVRLFKEKGAWTPAAEALQAKAPK